jgi:hypothetical protein
MDTRVDIKPAYDAVYCNAHREYGFRACAKWRIPDVQLHIGE